MAKWWTDSYGAWHFKWGPLRACITKPGGFSNIMGWYWRRADGKVHKG